MPDGREVRERFASFAFHELHQKSGAATRLNLTARPVNDVLASYGTAAGAR